MVFFFANMWPSNMGRGITKKVYAQIEAMGKVGYPVSFYTGYFANKAVIFDSKGNEIYSRQIPGRLKILQRIFRNQSLKLATYDFFKDNQELLKEVKIAYFRYVYFDYAMIKALKQAKKNGYYVILEFHSYPPYFWNNYKLIPTYIIDILHRKKAIQYIDRIAGMTEEKNIYGIETINFGNGIDLSKISKQNKVEEENTIRLISVSYEWAVHGYDRVLRGLADYYKQENHLYKVKVIFVGSILKSTRKLIDKLKIGEYVETPGIKCGDELDDYYNHADLGLGLMAIHRRKTLSCSALKTKEYVAKGIPFIFSESPTMEFADFPYGLHIKSDETPIDINQVIKFYEEMMKIPDLQEKMRKWAINFSWESQMKKVFNGIKELIM